MLIANITPTITLTRDLNTAYNIRDEGLKSLAKVSGCGSQSDVKQKHVVTLSHKESMKHEAPTFRQK